ncbi:TIGR02678 family protein [Nocardia callitridis]|uniref:TIGR02678 family protein n=1 Tax=Nocardia callitridis TaxID=648753 RepID=A0ABP9K891_9NOCA
MAHGRTIGALALDNYQRAARVVLANHLITRTFPDRIALPLVRRWATELREDLAELFGYRLEVTETTARVFPVLDRLDGGKPARTPADRVFDRRRYAYLALVLSALGRAGEQTTLSELADQVAADTARVDGLDLSTDRAADRDAFVDAVGWLAHRGALTLADGDAGGWVSDPEAGEALYDIDRQVVFALFRPPRALQHLHSVRGLLTEDPAATAHPAAADLERAARRALVERPVVYLTDLSPEQRPALGRDRVVAEVELFTGLRAERRAEGVALIDTSGRLSDVRFPGTGTLAQVALLLAGEIADRVLDIDHPLPHRFDDADPAQALIDQLDAAIPEATVFAPLAELRAADPALAEPDSDDEPIETRQASEAPSFPLVDAAWVHETMRALHDRYGTTFAAQWQADVTGLTTEVLGLLERLRMVRAVDDGVLVLPALARYRGAVVTVRAKRAAELFVTAADTDRPEDTAPTSPAGEGNR